MALYEGTNGHDLMAGSDNDGDESEAFGARAGNDTITGLNGDDVVDGGPGTDVAVFRGARSDYRFSLVVDDDMVGFLVFGVADTVSGRDGTDVLINVEFTQFRDGRLPWFNLPIDIRVDPAFGPADTVELYGGSANDTMTGHDGPDRFTGGLGNDVMVGGEGGPSDDNDTAVYVAASSSWVVMNPIAGGIKANLQTGIVTGAWGNDTLIAIENIEATPYADELTGNSANNVLDGGAGNDTLIGAQGNDLLHGDEGFDTAIFAGSISGYEVEMTGELRTVSDIQGPGGNDSLRSIERVLFDDVGIAYDLDGHAGDAARLIGVLFDGQSLGDRHLVRAVLEAFDAGHTAEEIAAYAVDLFYPDYTATQFSTLVYYNLAGFMPDEPDIAFLNGLIQEHSMAGLAVMAADTSYNDENIGFTGLMANGLEFVVS
ncbi:MAG: calcium-binding protein [Pseudomonadota bacterium]